MERSWKWSGLGLVLVALLSGCFSSTSVKEKSPSKSGGGQGPVLTPDLLQPGDTIPVFSSHDHANSWANISGATWDWGEYQLSSDGERLLFHSPSLLNQEVLADGSGALYRRNLKTGELLVANVDTQSQVRDYSRPAKLSKNGRYAIFSGNPTYDFSQSPGYSGLMIWRKDFQTGALEHVSTDSDASPYGNRMDNQVSADGRYVVYRNHGLIYRRDMTQSNAEVVSRSIDGSQVLESEMIGSGVISMSGDGQKVMFMASRVSDFIPGVSGEKQVIMINLLTNERMLVSSTSSGVPLDGASPAWVAQLSTDGSKVFFQGIPINLVAGLDSGSPTHIYRKDLSTGEVLLVSANDSGVPLVSGGMLSSVSDDGRFACFSTQDPLGLGASGVSGASRIKVKDLSTGALADLEYGPNGENLNSGQHRSACALSGDGRFGVITVRESDGRARLIYKQIRK